MNFNMSADYTLVYLEFFFKSKLGKPICEDSRQKQVKSFLSCESVKNTQSTIKRVYED